MQVSLSEAAQRLNVSTDTVRRRLLKGELKGTQEPTPQGYRWKIELPDAPTESPRIDPGNASADATLNALLTTMDTLRAQLEAQNNQIGELHRLLAQQALSQAPAQPWWRFWG